MPVFRIRLSKLPIIGSVFVLALLLLLLGGCGALRVAYSNGPTLAWWWMDGRFDFDSRQSPQVRQAIDRWFVWHRGTQLPGYAALLAQARAEVLGPTTPEAVCRWNERLREVLEPALTKAMEEAVELLPGLSEAQLQALAERSAKELAEDRETYLQADPAERRREARKRARERFERAYGRLGEAQLKVVDAGLAESPFDPERWMAERQRRQQDTMATLRRLVAEKPPREQRLATLRALAERSSTSSDPGYRELQRRLVEHNCNLVARVHNATTPTQRAKAQQTLLEWETDLRAVMAPPRGAGDPAAQGG